MTNEIRENLAKLFKANADKQMSLSKVLETTIAALRADKTGMGGLYADVVGDSRSDERKKFLSVFYQQMPHVVYNGTDKVIVVDWVEAKDQKGTKAIKQYRIAGEAMEKPDGCPTFISVEKDVKKMEIVTLASGYSMEVVSRDAEGNVITEKRQVRLLPREKTVWGYTDTVMQAFIVSVELIAG